MKPGVFVKIEKAHINPSSVNESLGYIWKPKNINKIQVRNNKLMQWRYFIQNKYLHKNQDKNRIIFLSNSLIALLLLGFQ